MKKTFKKVLSLLLVTVMVFGAAPLTGFIGLELPKMPSLPEFDGFEKISASVSDFFDGFAPKAEAASYTSGIFTYTVSGSNATITDCAISATGAAVVPETIGEYKVTAIGNYAFQDCTGLTSIDLGKVSSLGYAIFSGCTSLKSITFPNTFTTTTDYIYSYNRGPLAGSSVTDVVFEDGIKNIPDYACNDGTKVKNITLPEYEDYDINGYVIGQHAFSNTAIETITLPDTLTKINGSAFQNCAKLTDIVVTDEVTSIGDYAFNGCSSLKNVTIGKNVTSIGQYAFSGCFELVDFTMGTKVKTLGHFLFEGCTKLENINLKNVATFGYAVFNGCTGLTKITFPNDFTTTTDYIYSYNRGPLAGSSVTDVVFEDGIKNIPDYACNDGTKVKNITLPEYEDYDIYGYAIKQYAFKNTAIETITLPDTLTKINGNAFQDCAKLTDIVVTDEVTSIDDYVFNGCSSLKNVTIGKNVTSIGQYAFGGCIRLLDFTMGEKVRTLGHFLFDGCTRLVNINLKNVATFGYAIFNGCTRLTKITFPNDFTTTTDYIYSYNRGPLAGSSVTDVVFEDGIKNIPDYACNDGIYITNVTIPEFENYTVNGYVIGQCAFKNTAIETITLPDTLTKINGSAFQNCAKLTDIVVTDEVTSIDDYVFNGCSSLKNVTIGKNVTSIGQYAFGGCIRLLDFTMGEKVKTLGHFLFDGCLRLQNVDLKNVATFGYAIFSGCTRLTKITFPNDFTTTTDYIYSYNRGALAGSSVTDVVFEDGIKTVPNYACNGCSTLTTAYFPKSVTTVKSYAFPTKGNPTDVYYEGTEEEWKSILIETNNDGLINATVHYNYRPEVVTYTATFIVDGETLASYEIEAGAEITVPDAPSKDGYNFTGWTPEIPSAMPAEDITFTAVFEEESILVSHNLATFYADGEVYKLYVIRIGTEMPTPDAPEKEGHTFVGWTPEIPDVMPENDVDFHAVWGVNSYRIKFIVDGAVYEEYTAEYGSDFPDPEAPSKEGYIFAGWDKVVPMTVPAEDITLTALWEEIEPEYTLTFDANGGVFADGTTKKTVKYTYGASIDNYFEAPAREEYVFVGWDIIPATMPDHDITVKAEWERIPEPENVAYTVSILLENVDGETYTVVETYARTAPEGTTVSVTPEERTGFTVDVEASNLSEVLVIGYMTDLCVVYDRNEYTFTVDANGGKFADGTSKKTVKYLYGATVSTPETPSKEGYDFVSWSNSVPSKMPANNVTVTAKWKAVETPGCGHTETTVVTIPATCKVAGMKYSVCVECGETVGVPEVLPVIPHTIVTVVTVEPTCTREGKEYDKCSACGDRIGAERTIAKLPHTPGEWETVTEPTCTTEGEKVQKCTVCGLIIDTETIPVKPHTPGEWETETEPTCTSEGKKVKKCTVCSEILDTITLDPLPHTPGEWETVTEPTGTSEGKKVQKCTVCGTVLAEQIIPKNEVLKDDETGIEIEYPDGSQGDNVAIVVEESFDGSAFNLIDTKTDATQSFIYDIKMTVNGYETQPQGAVTVRIPLPEGYDANRSFIYHVNTETGKVEKMNASVETINGKKYLVFETTHFSYYAVVEEGLVKVEIRKPSITTINYGDSIILHADTSNLPAGYTVKWTADNGNFSYTANGATCTINPEKSGDTTFTATVYDANGNEVSSDTQKMTSKAGFFQKIIAFFKGLFGLNKTYPQAF